MTSMPHTDELGRRLLAVADRVDDFDWGDVLERARGLGRRSAPRPRRRRRAMLVVGLGVAVLATSAAWAASATNALDLFRANRYDDRPGDSVWHQSVVASSVRPAATVEIPGAGTFTFWYARTRQGGWCAALRLPSGGWAGGPGGKRGLGSYPGCFPTGRQINRGGPGPVVLLTGFAYLESAVTVHGTRWVISYGVVDGKGPAARVLDRTSGRSATVEDGHLFAVAAPNTPYSQPAHLVALDRAGLVVADDARPSHPTAVADATGTLGLFRANAPEHLNGDRGDPVWHETVIAASLVRAATIRIPRAGEFAFWYATTRQHGWCAALGLPSGGWAGGPGGENVGASLPGCYPTRTQINAAQVEHGGGPVYEITGFDYNESDLTVHGTRWRIYFGVIDGLRPAVRVVDTTAGRSAPVTDGHLFAVAVPADPSGSVRFVAYDRKGAVVADTRHPLR